MNEINNLETVMQLVMYGGDAKGNAIEAIQAAKEGKFELAEEKLKEAKNSLLQAHNSQTELLSNEAKGNKSDISLLLIHGQDHLMTAIAFTDLAKEFVEVYKRI